MFQCLFLMKKPVFVVLAILTLFACQPNSEETYLNFLNANLSLPDRVDYTRDFYARQVRLSLQARRELPWGKQVPEREFRHFVLPPRVNNEDMDDFRDLYYTELRQRVQGLTMTEAILEVNHWCHEHVTYRPTSARTLGPVSTVRTAYGRCGEESVLTVAALRTVGIPARQVYTPRWAHTDDNHAWVEAWADGRWWFLGACEPEPILDMGWFNESASRGMLMHTKVFGDYDGPEEVVSRTHALTEINVIGNYAPARRLTVCVVDSLNRPVSEATVEFKVYNYAEFYTVATKRTDADGHAWLTAGLGDMLVWASTPDGMAFRQVSFARDSLVTLRLSSPQSFGDSVGLHKGWNLDITPPAVSATLPTVTADQRSENNRRLAIEDSIRAAYEATMPDQRSRGNHGVIAAFRDSATALGLLPLADTLIHFLPDKDLQDVTFDVLYDNLVHQSTTSSPSLANAHYLFSPRIERERLTPYKRPLHEAFNGFDIARLIRWTRDSLTLIDDQNPQQLRMTPLGVFNSRTADRLGRDIFFVAAARSIGIPARINEINGKVQYISDGQWIDVAFESSAAETEKHPTSPEGTLLLSYAPTSHIPDAKYYIHFTLSRLTDDNRLQLLTYPEDATFQSTFAQGVTLDPGTYILTTGTRMANGSMLSQMQRFCITSGQATSVPFTLRTSSDAVAVIGSLNAEDLYLPVTPNDLATTTATSLLSTCGRGYYALGLIAPNQEPTNHALRDIALVGSDFEKWGRRLVLLFADADAASRFNFKEFDGLPATTAWGTDIDGAIHREVVEQMHLDARSLPIFLICDSFNRVVFVQQGYTIGLGEQMLKVIRQL